MSRVYSTEELIQILADERQACMNGRRLSLAASPSGIPVIDLFLKTDGIQKFTAYQDFRATVHQYQRDHQVSGIVWHKVVIKETAFHYPKVHDQLIALPDDLEVLRSAKDAIVTYWREISEGMDLYLSMSGGKFHQQMTLADGDRIIDRSEWASLSQQGKSTSLEIILQLGWGVPEEATYRRGFPHSGSECIHAVNPGNQPLG